MTPRQLDLVLSTGDCIAADPTTFSTAFYTRLFDIAPSVRTLFPADLTEQSEKLVSELVFLIRAADDLDTFLTAARSLGVRHVDYGVEPSFYEPLEVALLHALGVILDSQWTPEVETAWRTLYRLIAEAMLDGASAQLFG